jgi:poly(3-hydroxybutyrate) depolymerase
MRRAGLWLTITLCGCGASTETPPSTTSAEDTGSATTTDTGSTPIEDTSTPLPEDSAMPTDSGTATTDAPPTETTPMGCITEIAAGTKVFTCEGLKYDVTVPDACTKAGCGLVLDVHGATMSGKMEDNNTNMRALGAKYGYVIVQPNATPAPPSSSWSPATDDPKVFAFLESAIATYGIDKNRVHMTGFSQGGMMTSRFLCKHADVFASVAPAAGTGCTFKGSDTPSREVPVLYIHGETDALVSFSQGTAQRDAAVSAWKLGAETTVSSDANYKWTRRTSAAGTVFEFISHKYEASSFVLKGHCYPGSKDLKGGEPGQLFGFGCEGTNAFIWGEEVMKFFRDHPRK